jgi:hypothetical protein
MGSNPIGHPKFEFVPVAQLDSAFPSEGKGREFESHRERQGTLFEIGLPRRPSCLDIAHFALVVQLYRAYGYEP